MDTTESNIWYCRLGCRVVKADELIWLSSVMSCDRAIVYALQSLYPRSL